MEATRRGGGTPQEKKARLFGILGTDGGASRQRPMLVVLEDAHWLDPTSAELFERVVDRIAGSADPFVATLRPDVHAALDEFSACHIAYS